MQLCCMTVPLALNRSCSRYFHDKRIRQYHQTNRFPRSIRMLIYIIDIIIVPIARNYLCHRLTAGVQAVYCEYFNVCHHEVSRASICIVGIKCLLNSITQNTIKSVWFFIQETASNTKLHDLRMTCLRCLDFNGTFTRR